ncbi:MAG: hypothetical protein AAF909_07655 [Pseudomonadota bacterium]
MPRIVERHLDRTTKNVITPTTATAPASAAMGRSKAARVRRFIARSIQPSGAVDPARIEGLKSVRIERAAAR